MAHHRAIGVASQAICELLRERSRSSVFGPLTVDAYGPKSFEAPMASGISVFLWRVTPNGNRRHQPGRVLPDGRRTRPPLPVDLHYCLTPWAETPQMQHRLLGWMMRAIDDFGPVPAAILNNAQGDVEPDTFREAESLDLVLDPLGLADFLTFWDRLKTLPVSAHYVTRMLLLESEVPLDEYPPVEERRFQMAEPA